MDEKSEVQLCIIKSVIRALDKRGYLKIIKG